MSTEVEKLGCGDSLDQLFESASQVRSIVMMSDNMKKGQREIDLNGRGGHQAETFEASEQIDQAAFNFLVKDGKLGHMQLVSSLKLGFEIYCISQDLFYCIKALGQL